MRRFLGAFLLVPLLSLGILLEGAGVPVDLTGASAEITVGSDSGSGVWIDIIRAPSSIVSVRAQTSGTNVSMYPLNENFTIRNYGLQVFYDGDPASSLDWSLDMNDLDFGALGVHSLSIAGQFTFDSVEDEVVWTLDSAPSLVFGPGNEYILTILGVASSFGNPNIETELTLSANSAFFGLLRAHLSNVPVPEPETYLLLGSLLALGALARRRSVA